MFHIHVKGFVILLFALFAGWLHGADLFDSVKLAKYARMEKTADGPVLIAEIPASAGLAESMSYIPLDLKPYINKTLRFSCKFRGKEIKKGPEGYRGAKFMLVYTVKGKKYYPEQMPRRHGTFDWQATSFTVDVPPGVTNARLSIGLQKAHGTVEFKEVTFKECRNFKIDLPKGFRCPYTSSADKKHTTLRGVMSPALGKLTPEDIRELGSWKANVIRWQFNPRGRESQKISEYETLIDEDLNRLEKFIPAFEKAGIRVIYDIHQPPGGRMTDPSILGTAGTLAENARGSAAFKMFFDRNYLDCFIRQWEKIARRFKGCETIAGYDLVNEPDQNAEVTYDFLQIQYLAAQAIRKIDPEKTIYVTPRDWASPTAFETLQPLPLKNIAYTVHMYYPGSYTHQGVKKSWNDVLQGKLLTYPGKIDGIYADKEALRKRLAPVRRFQQKYGAKILVGEFSVTRWAPGGAEYLQDCISLFEEYGWDWCYHAFREWHGWSVEHSDDPRNLSPVPHTLRKQVLLDAFKKNRL